MTAENEPQPRILVVDDVPANVRLLEAVLDPAGFAVSSASSGLETVERVVTELPDLVLPLYRPETGRYGSAVALFRHHSFWTAVSSGALALDREAPRT